MDVTTRTPLENANAAFLKLHILLSSGGVPPRAKDGNWDSLWGDVNAVNFLLMKDEPELGNAIQAVRDLYDAVAWFLVECIHRFAQWALQPVLNFDPDFLVGLWKRLYDHQYDDRLRYVAAPRYSVKGIKKASQEAIDALEVLNEYTVENPNFQAADRQTISAVEVVVDRLDYISAALAEDRRENRALYVAQGYRMAPFEDVTALFRVYGDFIRIWGEFYWVPPPTARGAISILAQINDAVNS
jgi:hypothetical protein